MFDNHHVDFKEMTLSSRASCKGSIYTLWLESWILFSPSATWHKVLSSRISIYNLISRHIHLIKIVKHHHLINNCQVLSHEKTHQAPSHEQSYPWTTRLMNNNLVGIITWENTSNIITWTIISLNNNIDEDSI